jgi:hypothetical protein
MRRPFLHLLGFVRLDRLAQRVISRPSLSLALGLLYGPFTTRPIVGFLAWPAASRQLTAAQQLLQFFIHPLFRVDEVANALKFSIHSNHLPSVG